jgi:hypothetical protein
MGAGFVVALENPDHLAALLGFVEIELSRDFHE